MWRCRRTKRRFLRTGGVEELVVEVGLGFEGQEGDNVGGWEKEVWRRRWEWKASAGVDSGGDEEEMWKMRK